MIKLIKSDTLLTHVIDSTIGYCYYLLLSFPPFDSPPCSPIATSMKIQNVSRSYFKNRIWLIFSIYIACLLAQVSMATMALAYYVFPERNCLFFERVL